MDSLLNLSAEYFIRRKCTPGWFLHRHVMPIHGIVLLLDGNARYRIDRQDYSASAGDLIYFSPGCTREGCSDNMLCFAFDFTTTSNSFSLPVQSRFYYTEEVKRLIRQFEVAWIQKEPHYKTKCNAILIMILSHLCLDNDPGQENPHICRIKQYITRHLTEELSMQKLADTVGLSPVYCGAIFRKSQGMTIAQYTNQLRIQRAVELIENDHDTIKQIAGLCGFNDVYYFSKTFKRIMGSSPAQHRKSQRK